MEKSSQNENIINNSDEIYLNEVVMEEEKMEKNSKIQPSLQTKENMNVDEGGRKNYGKFEKNASSNKKVEMW